MAELSQIPDAPWGRVEELELSREKAPDVGYKVDHDLSGLMMEMDPAKPGQWRAGQYGHAEGGYLLVRLDIDGTSGDVVHVSPSDHHEVLTRALEILTLVKRRLWLIDTAMDEAVDLDREVRTA